MAAGDVNLIRNYIYFYHLHEYVVLPLYPDQITDNMPSTFQPTNALSRSAPVFTYSNSGPRSVQFNFDLHRDLMNDVNYGLDTLKQTISDLGKVLLKSKPEIIEHRQDYIDILIKYLQAAALPNYRVYASKVKSVEPPMVAIRLGNTLFIKGVVSSGVNVSWKKPIMTGGKYALASISFTVSEVDPYDASKIKDVGSFRTAAAGIKVY